MRIEVLKNEKTTTYNLKANGLKGDALKEILALDLEYPCNIKFHVGKLIIEQEFEKKPTKEELKSEVSSIMEEIKAFRKTSKTFSEENKTFYNGALKYKTVGGVFLKEKTINSLIGPDFKRNLINVAKKPNNTNKAPHVGLELEMIIKCSAEQLREVFIEENLYKYVNLGSDGSVSTSSGKGGNPVELRVMCLESEVETIVNKICTILNSKKVSAYVNSSCGFHVHMDCRHRDVEKVFKNLVMGLPLLSSMVPQERVTGVSGRTHYCKQNDTGNFETAKKESDRYHAVNPQSYGEHKTIEVRLHSGTTNAKKIINWVKVLAYLVNHETKLNKRIKTASDFNVVCKDSALLKYVEKRAALFSAHNLDTDGDELITNLIDSGQLANIVNL